MTDTREDTLEPTAAEIARVMLALNGATPEFINSGQLRAFARAAILAMDRRTSPPAEVVAWQHLKNGKWVECSEFVAKGWGNTYGPDVRPLYASPAAEPVAVPEGLADRLNNSAELLEGLETLPKPYDLYYAVKNEGVLSGWSYYCAHIGVADIRAAANALASPPAPAAPEHNEGYKRAFAAQSRKLQAVLHIPGVKETLAQLDWQEWDEGASAVAVPEGWKLVPVDPTEAMLVAGCNHDDPLGGLVDWRGANVTTRETIGGVYAAMLAAALPNSPQAEGQAP